MIRRFSDFQQSQQTQERDKWYLAKSVAIAGEKIGLLLRHLRQQLRYI